MISSLPPRVEEAGHLGAAAFIGLGRGIGEVVQAAMHVGVFALVGLRHAIEHLPRLLRRGGVVEIDQRLAVDLQRQRRKIRAHAVDVVGAVRDCRMHAHPRASSQRSPRGDRQIAQVVVDDGFDRLADEGLDQQRLRVLLRQAAGAQIEQQRFIQRAGGRAMAAGDVVGEDFQLRLAVGLGLVGQQQRPRHHLGVGLLRMRPHDDAALEHRMGAAVEHRAEHLAAGAMRHRVIEEQRGVGVLACRSAD